jgi:hypothetical protein
MGRPQRTVEQLIDDMTKKSLLGDNGCWLFQGAKDTGGYCYVSFKNRMISIHRISAHYHWGFGLDSSMNILHKCNTRNCWNPNHIYEGTQSENMLDMVEAGMHHEKNRTTCNYGHSLDGIKKTGWRYCTICDKIYKEKHKND